MLFFKASSSSSSSSGDGESATLQDRRSYWLACCFQWVHHDHDDHDDHDNHDDRDDQYIDNGLDHYELLAIAIVVKLVFLSFTFIVEFKFLPCIQTICNFRNIQNIHNMHISQDLNIFMSYKYKALNTPNTIMEEKMQNKHI